MAEIPVERKAKSAFPWWLIPLVLVLLVLPLLYYYSRADNNNANSADRTVVNSMNANNNGVITNANGAR